MEINPKSWVYCLVLCLAHSNECTRLHLCLSASLNRPMSMSMISFLRTIRLTKHLHWFASFHSSYVWGVVGVVAKYLRHIISDFRITATSWRWGTWCWLTIWRTSRRLLTRSTTRGSGECGVVNPSWNISHEMIWSGLTSSGRWWAAPGTTGWVSRGSHSMEMSNVYISRLMAQILMMSTRGQWRTLTDTRRESGRTRSWLTSSTRAWSPSSGGRKWGTCSTRSTSSRLSFDSNLYIHILYLYLASLPWKMKQCRIFLYSFIQKWSFFWHFLNQY